MSDEMTQCWEFRWTRKKVLEMMRNKGDTHCSSRPHSTRRVGGKQPLLRGLEGNQCLQRQPGFSQVKNVLGTLGEVAEVKGKDWLLA